MKSELLNTEMPELVTVEATLADADVIWQLIDKAAQRLVQDHNASHWADWYTLDVVREKLAHTHVYICRIGIEVVGVYSLSEELPGYFEIDPEFTYQAKPKSMSLGMLGVSPDLQGKGIGKFLLKDAETRALELGYEYLIFDTNSRVEPVVQFYLNQGYTKVAELQDDDIYFVFEKRLG